MVRKVLLLGADGFLGKNIYLNLLNDDSFNVIGTSRKKIENKLYFDLNERHQINFTDYEIVIFLAGISSIQECEQFPELAHQTNYLSTIRIIDECVNSGCFVIFPSSNSVFNGKNNFYKVNDPKDPKSKYGEYKDAVERWVAEQHQKEVAILRMTKVIPDYGAPRFAQRWISEIKDNGETDVYINHFVSPITQNKVFNALMHLIQRKQGGIFQLGGKAEISYAEYAKNFFKNDEYSLNCLKFIKKGDGVIYNSLKTFLLD